MYSSRAVHSKSEIRFKLLLTPAFLDHKVLKTQPVAANQRTASIELGPMRVDHSDKR